MVRQSISNGSPLRNAPSCTRLPTADQFDEVLRRKWDVGLYIRCNNSLGIRRDQIVRLRKSLRSSQLGKKWGEGLLQLLDIDIKFTQANPWDSDEAVDGPSSNSTLTMLTMDLGPD